MISIKFSEMIFSFFVALSLGLISCRAEEGADSEKPSTHNSVQTDQGDLFAASSGSAGFYNKTMGFSKISNLIATADICNHRLSKTAPGCIAYCQDCNGAAAGLQESLNNGMQLLQDIKMLSPQTGAQIACVQEVASATWTFVDLGRAAQKKYRGYNDKQKLAIDGIASGALSICAMAQCLTTIPGGQSAATIATACAIGNVIATAVKCTNYTLDAPNGTPFLQGAEAACRAEHRDAHEFHRLTCPAPYGNSLTARSCEIQTVQGFLGKVKEKIIGGRTLIQIQQDCALAVNDPTKQIASAARGTCGVSCVRNTLWTREANCPMGPNY